MLISTSPRSRASFSMRETLERETPLAADLVLVQPLQVVELRHLHQQARALIVHELPSRMRGHLHRCPGAQYSGRWVPRRGGMHPSL